MLRRLEFAEKVEAMNILFKHLKSEHKADTVSLNVLKETPHDKESVSAHFILGFVTYQVLQAFTHLYQF